MTELTHVGTPHQGSTPHSGRWKWGSGEDPYQRSTSFLAEVDRLRKKLGMSEVEAAAELGMNTAQLRARKTAAKAEKRAGDVARARQMREKGMSYDAIADKLGVSLSTARKLTEGGILTKNTKAEEAMQVLKENVEELKYVEFGVGTDARLGVSSTQLNTAVQMLKDEGYEVHTYHVKQVGKDHEHYTPMRVLCPPGTTKADLKANADMIRSPRVTIDMSGQLSGVVRKPTSVSSKRLQVRYDEDGGGDMDGVIELRRGVQDISLGTKTYAQVRILVDGTHYMKGMAIYADDLPDGVDIRYNTPKKKGTPALGPKDNTVLKVANSDDPTNPFGSAINQKEYKDKKTGRTKVSALNFVNEEGGWDKWSRTLPSQYLSKQLPSQIKQQLGISTKRRQEQLDEIMSLTNPAIKKKLLLSFAESCDSDSIELKAAAYPRQAMQVLLPNPKMKKGEIYAPNFKNGETVALVRFPHAGTFEIPELVVNNKVQSAIKRIGKNARDAVMIHPSVAERLSGADFDGDTVMVIPNNDKKVRTSPSLRGLKGFDPKKAYPKKPGMKPMTERAKQMEMGIVSNLITDMTLKGATSDELARAVRHSMVVIDAYKHELDYKQSELDNDIRGLKKKYQGKSSGGASTLVSRAKGPMYVQDRRKRRASEGGYIDSKTGDLIYTTKEPKPGQKPKMIKVPKMGETRDAYTLSSGHPKETLYAEYANGMKDLARRARLESLKVEKTPYSPAAAKKHKTEADSLRAKLKEIYYKKPLERQAQVVANAIVRLKVEKDPSLRLKENKDSLKKVERQALTEARARTGAGKNRIHITPLEWEAIQAGAITNNMLENILDNTDTDVVQKYATPKTKITSTASQRNKIATLKANGYTNAEIAEAVGMSTSTVSKIINGEDE